MAVMHLNPWHILLLATAGWMNREQGAVVEYLKEENRVLREVGYPADAIRRVKAFITKENWPAEPEACALEDADCLVFLETKLQNYVDEWEEEKTLRVLQRALRKMTADAREHSLRLKLGERERELVRRAVT